MRKTLLFSLICAMCLLATTVHAGWGDFWRRCHLDWHRNTAWPEPHQHYEADRVREPFRIMINKGYQLQNTLADYHFDPETHQLNTSGKMKIDVILRQPEARRTVFVYQAPNRNLTAIRVDSAQQHIASAMQEGSMPAVLATNAAPRGWPAENIDRVNRGFQPAAPVLPAATGGGGGGGGGS